MKIDESSMKNYLTKKDKMNLHNFMALNMKPQKEENDNNNNRRYNRKNRYNRNNRNDGDNKSQDDITPLHNKLIEMVHIFLNY